MFKCLTHLLDVFFQTAFNVNESTPVVLVNILNSDKHGGSHLFVDRCNCLTAGLCKTGDPWIVNLCRRMVLREMESFARYSAWSTYLACRNYAEQVRCHDWECVHRRCHWPRCLPTAQNCWEVAISIP